MFSAASNVPTAPAVGVADPGRSRRLQAGDLPPPSPGERRGRGIDRRFFLQGLAAGALSACAPLRATAFDAVVARDPRAGHGVPVFDSVGAAIAAAPPGATPWRVRVTPGRWREKLVVERANVSLVGDDRARCVLTHDAAAGHIAPDGKPWGTWRCASVIVRAPGFSARRLTLANDFDYLGHLRQPTLETIGSNGAQAVALMLDTGADRSRFDDVDLIGHQDTLFVDAGRSLYTGCRISGSVDFVFGAGSAWFERCTLVSRFRPGKERQGYVAVPSTLAAQATGLVFHECTLRCEPEVPRASVALGRPWRPTRHHADGDYGDAKVVGSAVYLDCWMDEHIDPAGWDAMDYTARDGRRVKFLPADARFFEYRSRGPGAVISAQRPQLGVAEVARFRSDSVFAKSP